MTDVQQGSVVRQLGIRASVACIVLVAAGLLGALALTAAVVAAGGGALAMDETALELVLALRSEGLTAAMKAITVLGTLVALLALALAAALLVPRARRAALWCGVGAVVVNLLNVGLKALVARPRPDEALRLIAITGTSFPSGHAMNAVAFFGLVAWFVWQSGLSRGRRALAAAACVLLAALICVSRVYLGVHYLSDVLAGACASLVWLVCYTRVIRNVSGLGTVPKPDRQHGA